MTDRNRIAAQSREFDAVRVLAAHYRSIEMTPVVDDDYPEVRFGYEQAMRRLIEAMAANGRFNGATA